jgi:hypothetical protein
MKNEKNEKNKKEKTHLWLAKVPPLVGNL